MDSTTKDRDAFLSADVGGTFIKSGVMNRAGELLPGSSLCVPVDSDGSREGIISSLSDVVESCSTFIANNGLSLAGIGIAIPGPFDYGRGIPLMTHKFASLYGMNLREAVYEMAGIGREIPVLFMHDVNIALEGELWRGNARNHPNSALISLGTGLGFACSQGGVVQCSPTGSPAVTIFKTPWHDGILEEYVSKRGFLHAYGELAGNIPEGMTVAEIGRMADRGDRVALRTFEMVGSIIAEATKDILRELHTECLLLGGQISGSFHHLEGALREGLSELPELKLITTVKDTEQAAFNGIICRFI